ncbi:MAG: glycosyltransferase [Chloroflexi bacterium]|nr:glycosyltransferase [Chloroflexota bacterium]
MMGRILILYPAGHLDRTPSVKHLAHILAQGGFFVDILTISNVTVPKSTFAHENINVLHIPIKLYTFYEPIPYVLAMFSLHGLRIYLRNHYDCIIGAGIRGLYVGTFWSLIRRVPLVYHSLELYPSWERHRCLDRLAKAIERWANRKCAFTIIQDESRAKLLAEDNGVPMDRMIFMPNAAPGKASRKKSIYIKARFGIPTEKVIILFAGTLFAKWAPTLALVRRAQEWPDDWVLVLHSNTTLSDEWRETIKAADRKDRVILSCDPVPYEQLHEIIASADVGLAIYTSNDTNMSNMGLSSGKIAEYLRWGVPVVVSDLQYTADVIRQYHCGIVIDKLEALEGAIRQILSNYERYADGAVRCFNEVWSLDNYRSVIVQAFMEVMWSREGSVG